MRPTWTGSTQVQASLRAVGDVIRAEFGRETKEYSRQPLELGYIGTSLDEPTRTAVVVVDPGLVDMEALARRLEAAAGPGFQVRVEPGAFSASELLQAMTVIGDGDWHPRVGEASFGYHVDAASSRIEVTFDERDADVAEALRARLGDRVHIKWGTPSRL